MIEQNAQPGEGHPATFILCILFYESYNRLSDFFSLLLVHLMLLFYARSYPCTDSFYLIISPSKNLARFPCFLLHSEDQWLLEG